MNRGVQILIAITGISLTSVAVVEHVYRRSIERRYHEAVEARQKLELQFGEVLATHQQLKADLQREQQRSQELTGALASARGQLEQAVGHLTEEAQNTRKLQLRLTAMQQQMDQLQGELVVALQERPSGPAGGKEPGPVQLERVVVSDAQSSDLHGRVLSIHQDWNFIVIDLGWDAVRIGDVVSIFHDNELQAKARIERVQEGICAATILPEWKADGIRINDVVRVL